MQFLTKLSSLFSGQKNVSFTPEFERLHLQRRNRSLLNETDLFKAYTSHELVYGCINKIADVMNDAEIIVEKLNAKSEWEPVAGHALASLFKRPNSHETGREFRRLMVQSEQAVGIFYGEMIRSAAGIVVEVHPLNPNRVAPKLNQDRTGILFYEYTRSDGRRYPIKPEDMLTRRRSDLVNRFFGLSPLSVALKSINSDIGLTDYIDAFFESDGTPSGILKILQATLSDEKKRALQAQWQRKYSRGGSSQKGVAILDQTADYQKIGSNLDELASDALSGRFESRICSVFGVPPNLVGAYVGLLHVTANATVKADLRNFWDNKISGELSLLREWLTWFVLPEFENIDLIKAEKIRVGFDVKHVAFLQEDVNEVHKRARENFRAGGWTLNEFRTATGMMPDKSGDYYLQPLSLSALSPENRAIEAFSKVPKDGEPEKEEDKEPDKETAPPKSLPENTEKKTFEFDGLTLGREPSELEQLISLKTIVRDFEAEKEKASKLLLSFRNSLIEQAVEEIRKLTPETVFSLTLTPTANIRTKVLKILKSAYSRGRNQVIGEVNAQSGGKYDLPSHKKDEFDDEYLDDLMAVAIARVINEIQSRSVNIYVSLQTLLDFSEEALREALQDESTKFVEQTAANVVNAAMQKGRFAEITELLSIDPNAYKYCEYSAVLDKGTCSVCRDADGETGATPADVSTAPNPECEGGWNCRCFVVLVTV